MKKCVILSLLFFTINLVVSYAQLSFFDTGTNIESENVTSWTVSTENLENNRVKLNISVDIADGWHLYSQKHKGSATPLQFYLKKNDNYIFEDNSFSESPKYIEKYDSIMKENERYLVGVASFSKIIKVKCSSVFTISCDYEGQICMDGMCRPERGTLDFNISYPTYSEPEIIKTEEYAEQHICDTVQVLDSVVVASEGVTFNYVDDGFADEYHSLWLFFLIAFGGGLLGLLTPCVFPMIPMTVSYFMKHGGKKQAILYGVSIVVIYILFGIVLSAIFGQQFANALSTHWLPNILFALIFVVFALSLLGYFEITLPSWLLNSSAKREEKSGYIGTFFMALTLVLVSFSCTLPIAGAVALGSADGGFVKPLVGMLGFSLAFALPFTFFAFFPSLLSKLPKSGGWMNVIKVSLAFVELAFALKFINVPDQTYHWNIFDREIYLSIWIVLFSLLGFYLLGKIRFPLDDEYNVQKSPLRFVLSIAVFSFVVYMIPGLWGAPLNGISGWLPAIHTQDYVISKGENNITSKSECSFSDKLNSPMGIDSYFDYDEAITAALISGKPIFVDFTGHGCVNCRKMEQVILADNDIRNYIAQNFIICTLYVDDKVLKLPENLCVTKDDGSLIEYLGDKNYYIQNKVFKQNSQPCYIVVNANDNSVLSGPMGYCSNKREFLNFLERGLKALK